MLSGLCLQRPDRQRCAQPMFKFTQQNFFVKRRFDVIDVSDQSEPVWMPASDSLIRVRTSSRHTSGCALRHVTFPLTDTDRCLMDQLLGKSDCSPWRVPGISQ